MDYSNNGPAIRGYFLMLGGRVYEPSCSVYASYGNIHDFEWYRAMPRIDGSPMTPAQTRKSPEEIAEMLWIEIHKDDAKRETQIHRLANFIQSERNQRVSVSLEEILSSLPKKQKYNGIHDNFITGFNDALNQTERAILSLLGGTTK